MVYRICINTVPNNFYYNTKQVDNSSLFHFWLEVGILISFMQVIQLSSRAFKVSIETVVKIRSFGYIFNLLVVPSRSQGIMVK